MTQLKKSASTIATEMVECSYSIFPYEQTLVPIVSDLYQDFLHRRKSLGDLKKWSYRLPDEHEDDLGLIAPRAGKDVKYFFHYNHVLATFLSSMGRASEKMVCLPADVEFMRANSMLYADLNNIAHRIAVALDEIYGFDIADDIAIASQATQPYSTSTLRLLSYPDVPEQSGAKANIDRSCITIHLGDKGGNLLALKQPGDYTGKIISPPPGHAVAFFGIKMLGASKGTVQPLWHESATIKGQGREAMVHFSHINVPGHVVVDAKKSLRYYKQLGG